MPQQFNPLFYNEVIMNSLHGLFAKGPVDAAKLAAATARAKALPGFIKDAKENLQTPPKEYTDAAIKQFPAILDYYKTELPKAIESSNGEAKAKFQAEWSKAVAALEDWGNYLSSDLLAKSTGNFRLGPAGHGRLLQLTGQNNIMMQELIDRTKADINNIKREMALICVSYYPVMYPDIDLTKISAGSDEANRNYVIKGVLDKFKGDHIAKADWISAIKTSADEIKAFIASSKLLDVPEGDLTIGPMEPYLQGLTWLKLIGPAPYETAGPFGVQIQPIPADWADDKAGSLLEEFNRFYLPFWTIERVYPGSFFPAAATRKNANILRKLYPSQPLIAGWPLYIEDMFIYAGLRRVRPPAAPEPAQAHAQGGHRLPDGAQRPPEHLHQGTGRGLHDPPGLHDPSRGRAQVGHHRPQPRVLHLPVHGVTGDPGPREAGQDGPGRSPSARRTSRPSC